MRVRTRRWRAQEGSGWWFWPWPTPVEVVFRHARCTRRASAAHATRSRSARCRKYTSFYRFTRSVGGFGPLQHAICERRKVRLPDGENPRFFSELDMHTMERDARGATASSTLLDSEGGG